MTLRAYRPNDGHNDMQNGMQSGMQNGMQNDWRDTLLDRPQNGRSNGGATRGAYGAPKSRIWMITGVFAIAAILITGYFVVKGRSDGGAIPLIQADSTPYKLQPAQPGGTEIPFQDKLVFNRLDPNGQPVQAEKLLPPAEEPTAANTAPATKPAPVASVTTTVAVAPSPAPATTITAAATPTVTAAPIEAPSGVSQPVAATQQRPQAVTTVTTTVAANPKTGTVTQPTMVPTSAVPAPAPATITTVTTTTRATTPTPPVLKPAMSTATISSGPTATGQARIQLASIPDEANAQKALPTLSSKYQSALGGAKLSLVRADIPGKGTYWRVQSQALDHATADRVCGTIKAQGGVCITAK